MNTQKPIRKIFNVKVDSHIDTDPDTSYLEQEEFDERLDQYKRDVFGYIGIQAVAEVGISLDGGKTFKIDHLTSGGLWGIESDSGNDYLNEVAEEELTSLKSTLIAYGFGRSSVTKAMKSAIRF